MHPDDSKNTPFQLTTSLWKIFSFEISDHRVGFSIPSFSLLANFHIPRVCDFDFMVIIDLRINKGSDCKNRLSLRCKVTPSAEISKFFVKGSYSTSMLLVTQVKLESLRDQKPRKLQRICYLLKFEINHSESSRKLKR